MAEAIGAGDRRPLVAVTRSIEDNRSLTDRLARLGFEVVAVPLVEVAAPTDGGRALGAAVAGLPDYDWVVLTSVNGVQSVGRVLDGRPWPAGVSVAVVGPTTAEAARSAGLPVDLVPGVATAAALVDGFPPAPSPTGPGSGRVLAPLARLADATVEQGLTAKGWRVDRVEAYRTAAPADERSPEAPDGDLHDAVDEDLDHHLDAVAFFSPSVVDRWVDRFGPAGAVAVCIGPSTAARARDRGLRRVVMATPHTEDGVVAALGRLRSSSR